MRQRLDLGLRGRLLVLVLVGVVLPLGLAGLWTSYSAQRTGIELVHQRLGEALSQTVDEFHRQWVRLRSVILDLSESPVVTRALSGERRWDVELDDESRAELSAIWAEVSSFVLYVELRDLQGRLVGRLPDALGPDVPVQPPLGTVDRDFPVLARFSGEELGSMTVRFRVEGILPAGFLAQGVGGSLPGIFDAESGVSLLPTSIEPSLFSRDAFTWRGEEWVTEALLSDEPRLRFVLAAPLEPVTAPYDRAARRGVVATLVVMILSVTLVTVFSRRLMQPLDRLASAASNVAQGDLSTQVDESGPPGLRDTARAFNAMSAALSDTLSELAGKEAMAAVGTFAADLAHEVRNPLTAIRTDLQRAERKLATDPDGARVLVERAVASVDRLNATVTDFLRVARSGTVAPEPCDVRAPLQAAIDASEPQRTQKGCPLAYERPDQPVQVAGDPDALRGMFLNLLLNAVEAVEPGGRLGVRVQTHARAPGRPGSSVTVEVWDHGPGIPEGLHATLFDPFVTTKPEGTGLGLAIAARVARAHGSELTTERRGSETVFRLSLPLLRS